MSEAHSMSPGVPNGHRLPGGMMLLLGDWHAVGFMRLHAGAHRPLAMPHRP